MDRSVLIVDNDRGQRSQLQMALASFGISAVGTSSELAALELLRTGRIFDAAIVGTRADCTHASLLAQQIANQCPWLIVVVIDPDGRAEFVNSKGALDDPRETRQMADSSLVLRLRGLAAHG